MSDEYADDFLALAEIAEVFTQLVAALTTGHVTAVSVERIVDLAARCMPRAQGAVLIGYVDDQLRTLSASSPIGEVITRAVAHAGQGPALDVIEANDVVVSDDVSADPRWPLLGDRLVGHAEVMSVVSYRLYLGSRHRAALSFYSNWPNGFDNLAISTGAVFAAYASLALSHDLIYGEPVPPARSRAVHTEIGVAIGILMTTGGDPTTQGAYRQLHDASRRLRQGLLATARYVVSHRELPT
jgi:hypothetical protein